ncbi:hypothetical protein [Streptomyces sp. NPDC059533]|uniref:hypothetical protein n=1 Tax=unclassified Streptomyces TaxID=2593676 RepID=UPI00367545E9
MADLTVYLLNREQAHWRRAVGEGSSSAAAPAPVRTPPELMNRTVFTAAQLPHRGARALDVQRIGADTAQLLHDHALLYPPEDPGSPTVLHPLQPDRLAEDFLALTLTATAPTIRRPRERGALVGAVSAGSTGLVLRQGRLAVGCAGELRGAGRCPGRDVRSSPQFPRSGRVVPAPQGCPHLNRAAQSGTDVGVGPARCPADR